MASIKRNYNKNGDLISVRIRVYKGHDEKGAEMTPFSRTVKIPPNLSPTKVEKFITQESLRFEEECKAGYANNTKMRFDEFADIALAEKEADGLKLSTIDGYEGHLKRLKEEFGHMKLDDIQPEHLDRFYSKLKQPGSNKKDPNKGLSPKTIREHHNTMSSIMHLAYNKKYIKENPCTRATPPKVQRKTPNYHQPLTLKAIIDCLLKEDIKWRTLIMIYIITGGRRGETLGLTWDSVDVDNNVLHFSKNVLYSPKIGIYIDSPKTDKSKRFLKVPQSTIDAIVKYKDYKLTEAKKIGIKINENDFIFTQDNGKPMHPDSVNNYLSKFSKKYDLPHCNPHAFRHTISSILIYEGYDSVTIADYLGNSVYHVENIYSHMIDEARTRVSNTIADKVLR